MAPKSKGKHHPILEELKLVNAKDAAFTAVDVLQNLLQAGVLTGDQVRSAYQNLQEDAGSSDTTSSQKDQQQPLTINENNISNQNKAAATETPQPFDYRTRHIALRIYYEGKKYSGLAQNVGQDYDNSVEKQLFVALQKKHLIQSRDTCGYSRCGRTDKGVSAVGQVVALQLKSAVALDASWDEEGQCPVNEEGRLPKHSFEKIPVWVNSRKKKKRKTNNKNTQDQDSTRQLKQVAEFPYDKMLNSVLPEDIRILGWCPVSPEFNARFSATSRTYRYFFVKRPNMDLERMREGLKLLEGKHDFRNFCKINVIEVSNFERHIRSAALIQLGNVLDDGSCLCYFQIVGQAFLWHQIRCIVSVLFFIGRGLESPSVIPELLNVDKYPGKPSYPLAEEFPLVLHDCGYHNLHIGYSVANLWTETCRLEEEWEKLTLEAARVRNCWNMLQTNVQNIQQKELVEFATHRLKERHKKIRRNAPKGLLCEADINTTEWEDFVQETQGNDTDSQTPVFLTWQESMQWLKRWNLIPNATGLREELHVPLLKRCKGTTYEEKVQAVQQAATSRRAAQYEENMNKKRKAEAVDASFYEHMFKQGGSAV